MRAAEIDLAQKVAALCRPDTYFEDSPSRVEVIETHMSFVFLTSDRAYKMKKPVRYAFLDFSTLELRRHCCEEELRLNQRLAAGVYLDVVALRLGLDGRLGIGVDGAVVEWLVKMVRLPRERMLDERIQLGRLAEQDLVALGARLGRFYRSCEPERLSADEYRSRLQAEIEIDRVALESHADVLVLDRRLVAATVAALLEFLNRGRVLLDRRIDERRVVEGHGDLRPEHVCLLDEPVVFDSLEFNRGLRIVDAADELAFLALECERLGAPQVGTILFQGYAARTGDSPPAPLVDFYKARRASLRARLCVLHLSEVNGRRGERWVALARDYLAMVQVYCAAFDQALPQTFH